MPSRPIRELREQSRDLELEAGAHRREVAEKLRARIRQQGIRKVPVPPEVLIREDRDR